jgi:hypothetical protein
MSGPDRRTPNWSRLDAAQSHLFPVTTDDEAIQTFLRSLSDEQLLGALRVARARANVELWRHEGNAPMLAEAIAELATVEAAAALPVGDAVEGTP